VAQMTSIIEGITGNWQGAAVASEQGASCRGHAVVARRKLTELHETMGKLVRRFVIGCAPASSPPKDHQSEYSAALFHCARQVARRGVRIVVGDYTTARRFILATMASDKTNSRTHLCVGRSRISSRYSERRRAATPTNAGGKSAQKWTIGSLASAIIGIPGTLPSREWEKNRPSLSGATLVEGSIHHQVQQIRNQPLRLLAQPR